MPNTFVWHELMTTDPAAAQAFYASVVGWSMSDGGHPEMNYVMVSAGGHGVGGITSLPAEARQAGASPRWMAYIGVDDTDVTAARIEQAGGRIIRAPDDIPGVGRFAVVADPGGAGFMLLSPLPRAEAPPPAPRGAHGTFGWNELFAGNGQEQAFDFYSALFGWSTLGMQDMGPMGQYRLFGAEGERIGGMMDKPPHVPLSSWNFYIQVDDFDAAIERTTANGGKVLMGPHEVPDGSWIVQAADPQGALFALVAARR